ncbi:MAG TPA: Obg family GTPase CgtA, partial [Fervidobacterium sp.]|nr:Obg family GTPase CgtA [Fervidobacterium sp.]
KGEEKTVLLELKLLADAGLIGYPNVGKSSIISRISNAHPKIANYPFTTLVPNLGVVVVDSTSGTSFMVADVPGLIKGASEGKGLGNIFLKHVERCEVIVHVLDLSGSDGRDPLQDYFDIRKELEFFNEALAKKPEVIVGNKCDLLSDDDLQIAKSRIEDKLGKKLILVSTVAGNGLDDLKYAIWDIIRESKKLFAGTLDLSKIEFVRPEPVRITMPDRIDVKIVRNGNDEFEVVSEYVKKYMEKYRMDAKYLLDDILEMLQKSGLDEKLRRAGAKDGDTVWLEGVEFTFKE